MGTDDGWSLERLTSLGITLYRGKKIEEAEALILQALDQHEIMTQSAQHTTDVASVILVGSFWHHAEKEVIYSHNHLHTIDMVYELGKYMMHVGNFGGAEELLHHGLKTQEIFPGSGTNDTWMHQGLNNLTNAPFIQGELEECFCHGLLARQEQVFVHWWDLVHHNTYDALWWLSRALYMQKKYMEVENYYHRLIECQEKVLGLDHIATLDTLDLLADILIIQNKVVEAEALLCQVIKCKGKIQGQDHHNTLKILDCLSYSLAERNKLEKKDKISVPLFKYRDNLPVWCHYKFIVTPEIHYISPPY